MSAGPQRLGATGLAFIAREEGLRLQPYNDSAGHATVGVGHLIHRGPVTAADRARYRSFTRADAIRLLRKDVASREAAVRQRVRVRLNQHEFDALVSLVFNIGAGAFATSTVLRELNAGNRRKAADAFLMWRRGGPGLIFRRRRERLVFLQPLPSVVSLAVLSETERHYANRLLWHRRAYRREAKTGKGPKFLAHKEYAASHRRWLEARIASLEADLRREADRHNRRRRAALLRRVVAATDGTL